MDLPKPLYKYLTVSRAKQILDDRTIRFTQPGQLNDAFEMIPSMDIERISKDYDETFRQSGSTSAGLDNFTLSIASEFLKDYKSVGVLCLSSSFDIPLMWGHYAENYAGVVIGFDIEKGLLDNRPERNSRDKFCDIGPITYSEDRFLYPQNIQDRLGFMYHKDQCWSYENEWRIVRSLNRLDNPVSDIFVSGFDWQAIRCVIFGPLMKNKEIHEILKILDRDEYEHVGKFQAFLEDDKFGVDIECFSAHLGDESSIIYSAAELELRKYRDTMLSKGVLFKTIGLMGKDTVFPKGKDILDLYDDFKNYES